MTSVALESSLSGPATIRNRLGTQRTMQEKTPTSNELEALVERVASSRDKQAFASLFDHFAPRLKSFMLRGGADPETAEEISQEAMIIVWNKAAQYDRSKAALSTWIFTIARNKRIDMLRREMRPSIEPENYPVADQDPPADSKVEQDEAAVVLRSRIKDLPDEQREVLQLAFFEDKSHGVISEELGLPLGTVKSRIRLALGRLRGNLGDLQP